MIDFRSVNGFDECEVLADGGVVSRAMPGFEPRPQQIRMVAEIHKALGAKRRLVIEAGTGVGKSYAYLIPFINQVRQTKRKALISTYTITLQEQLINKDVPFLADCLPGSFNAVVAKGRGNYLCLRRHDFTLKKQMQLFDRNAVILRQITTWSKETTDGSLSDLGFVPPGNIWEAVKSEHGNCRGKKCKHYRNCFYWRARRRLETADIIVANHALLFSDLALKEQSEKAGILPAFDNVVIDEAHNIEQVAEEHFGINLTSAMINFMLRRLYNPKTHKGLLAFTNAKEAIELVAEAAKAAKAFFENVEIWYEKNRTKTNGRCHKNFVEDTLTGPIRELRKELTKRSTEIEDVDEQFEIVRYIDKCRAIEDSAETFLPQKKPDDIYWVEIESKRRVNIRLRSASANVGEDIKRCLFDKYDSVILTSATLSCDGPDMKHSFDFFAGRVGLEDFNAVKLGSPFDYEKQVTMYIEADLPEPNHPDFEAGAVETIKKYIDQTRGRAFVLFTSYSMLNSMAKRLKDWFEENGIDLLRQGQNIDRTTLLTQFKTEENKVLFGTDSFWQGVDVPGEALSNVIITRLPFAVPNHPLIAGKIERIRKQGGKPFFDYQLPLAIIKFKQGFGRLIRHKTDNGIIVILDSRIINKNYGRSFLNAIPKCTIEIVHSD